jgi:hypothetical protein
VGSILSAHLQALSCLLAWLAIISQGLIQTELGTGRREAASTFLDMSLFRPYAVLLSNAGDLIIYFHGTENIMALAGSLFVFLLSSLASMIFQRRWLGSLEVS